MIYNISGEIQTNCRHPAHIVIAQNDNDQMIVPDDD